MTLAEILEAVEKLSPAEKRQLQATLYQQTTEWRAGTMDIDTLIKGIGVMREGLSDEGLKRCSTLPELRYNEIKM